MQLETQFCELGLLVSWHWRLRLLYLPALRLGVLRPNLSHRKDLHQDRINAFSVENIWLSDRSLNKLA